MKGIRKMTTRYSRKALFDKAAKYMYMTKIPKLNDAFQSGYFMLPMLSRQ
jgi:hypothetical protein